MDQEVRRGPRVEETLRDWRTAHRTLAEATARRERITAAARHEEPIGLSAAVLAERSAAAAEREAHQRFREARQRVVERYLRVSSQALGFDPGARGALMTSVSETSTI